MSRPEDIREQAKSIYFARCDEVSRLAQHFEEEEVIDLLVRAIMAAKAEEREACALLADGDAKFHIEAAAMSLPVSPGPIIAKDRAVMAKRIAVAIRKRGEG